MIFKKHHLFMLIVALILVASFIFPASPDKVIASSLFAEDPDKRWSVDEKDIKPSDPHIWIVDDIDDLPCDIASNDSLYVKKLMDKAFTSKYATILPGSIKVFKKNFPAPDELILENPRIVLIKGSSDDTQQEYYFIARDASFYPYLLPLGDLVIRYQVERKFNGTITERLNLEHKMTVLASDDPHISQINQGNDGSL